MPTPVQDPEFVEDMYKVRSWADVNFALKSPNMLVGRKIYRSVMDNILPQTNGQEHLHRRKIEARIFGREALGAYERSVLAPALDELTARWRSQGQGELVRDTLVLLARIGAKVTGIDGIETDDEALAIVRYADEFAAAGSVEFSRLPQEATQALIDRSEVSREEFDRRFVEPSRSRRAKMLEQVEDGELERSALPNDLITTLLANWQPHWKPEFLSLEVLTFLSGSIRTTMRAVCNAVQEIRDWVAVHPEDNERLLDPVFIRQAVNETLRLHTVTPFLLRMTADSVTLPSGPTIPANEYVAILYARANRDPSAFGDDAEDFDPRRSQRDTPGRDYGVSFAVGAHACIGRRLAVGSGGEDSSNTGTVMTIMHALLSMGVEPDPDNPPVPNPVTYYDEYSTFPVRFTNP